MHIILLILKVTGLVLLILLAFLLLITAVLLFAPFCYRAEARKTEDIFARMQISFLYPLFFIKAVYENTTVSYVAKIFGITVFPRKAKPKKRKTGGGRRKPESPEEGGLSIAQVGRTEFSAKEEEESGGYPLKVSQVPEAGAGMYGDTGDEKKADEKKTGRILSFFIQIKERFRRIKDNICTGREKIALILAFIGREENQRGLKRAFASVKQILRHILPGKIKGNLTFGMDDPCVTGQLLGLAAVFYPIYGKELTLTPDFGQKALEGEIFIKGRVRVFTLLRIGITLLTDKDWKQLRKNFEKMKEVF